MNAVASRRRFVRFASACVVLPLAAAGDALAADAPLKLPREPGAVPNRPVPRDVQPPTPSPAIWPRPERDRGTARPKRRPKQPPRLL